MSENKELFENVYKSPDAIWTKSTPPLELVELIENEMIKPCNAIDIGCGEGFYSIYLASRGFNVLGIDISERAIEYAKTNALRESNSIRFKAMDVSSLPALNDRFEFVLEWGVLHLIMPEYRKKYIQDIANILNRGGKYVSVCFSDKSEQIVESGSKYVTGSVGAKLYYSSRQELEKLYYPYFRVVDFKEIILTGNNGQTHVANFFCLEKLSELYHSPFGLLLRRAQYKFLKNQKEIAKKDH